MTIDWKSCKYRSIADSPCGRWQFIAERLRDGKWHWCVEWPDSTLKEPRVNHEPLDSMAEAQAACESWLSQQPPVLRAKWHVSDSGLAACSDEFHGYVLSARRRTGESLFMSHAMRIGGGGSNVMDGYDTLPAAQAAIEAEVLRVTDAEDSRLMEESKKLRPSREELLERVPAADVPKTAAEPDDLLYFLKAMAADKYTGARSAKMYSEAATRIANSVPVGPDGWVTDDPDDTKATVAWKRSGVSTLCLCKGGYYWFVYRNAERIENLFPSLAAAKAAAERAVGKDGG